MTYPAVKTPPQAASPAEWLPREITHGLREVCAAGGGLAALPCYLGDLDERLVRVHSPVKEMTNPLWVLIHPDLARTARIRLFVEFIVSALRSGRALLEGQRPRM